MSRRAILVLAAGGSVAFWLAWAAPPRHPLAHAQNPGPNRAASAKPAPERPAATGLTPAAVAQPEPTKDPAGKEPAGNKSAAVEKPSPLTPADALAAFQVEPGLRVELVAAEPLIESPVAVAFDARGRMFVAENRGYPTGPEDAGRIAMLEDTDHDGRYDRRSEFATGLSYPNGMLPWRDGMIVTAAPDILYLADTDGDGRSDQREVLFTGFSTAQSTQLRVSHPQFGLDNWIYVTGGLSGGKVTSPKNPDHPVVEFGRADFRFLPDCSQFEAVNGGGQFGMSFDDAGHRFILYNRVQVQHVVLPERYLKRNRHLPATSTVQDCPADMVPEPLAHHGHAARLYPISHNITTADSHAGTFTAACGLLIYRSSGLPERYRGCAFTCDPTGNLVHWDRLEPEGATFIAQRSEEPREFLASSDDWFRPCNLAQGPDGALYVCDMYRKTIEHPDYLPPEIRKHTDFESGKGMGRVWRVQASDVDTPKRAAEIAEFFAEAPATKDLSLGLWRQPGWWLDTVHRILVERRAGLKAGEASFCDKIGDDALMLRIAELFGVLKNKALVDSLSDPLPAAREQAIQIAETRLSDDPALLAAVAKLADDPDPRVRFQCALTLGESNDPLTIDPLVRIAVADSGNHWSRLAIESSIPGRELDFLQRYAGELTKGTVTGGATDLLGDLARLVGASQPASDWPAALQTLVAAVRPLPFAAQSATLVGFAEALRLRRGGATGSALQAVLKEDTDDSDQKFFAKLFAQALDTVHAAADTPGQAETRAAAIDLLADADPAIVGDTLLSLVDRRETPDVQQAAVRALRNLDDPSFAAHLLDADRFRGYSPPLREAVLAAMLAEPRLQAQLLTALESGSIPVGMVDSLRRRQLTEHRDPAIRDRAAKVFAASAVGNRAAVYEDYKSVLELTGHADKGRQVFLKSCSTCHRLDREGTPVGPDLFGIRTQPKEAILLHILIPEYEITPGFGAYMIETSDGRIEAGLLVGETANQVTLRAALGREETILRSDIESLALSKLSLMPQELEKTMSRQDLADLLSYLKGEAP